MKSLQILGVFILALILVEGIVPPLTPNDKIIVTKFREHLEDEGNKLDSKGSAYLQKWTEQNSDETIMNWISYEDRNVTKATDLLLKSLNWRRENDIDNILNWRPSKDFDPAKFPMRITGKSHSGKPVLYSQMGLWDVRTAVNSGKAGDLVRHTLQNVEKVLEDVKVANRKENATIGNFVVLVDLDEFTFRQVTSIRVLSVIGSTVGLIEGNYPFYAEDILIVNAPPFFNVVFQVVKSVLQAKTVERIQFLSDDPAEKARVLESLIPKSSLPPKLGGNGI